MYQWGKDLLRSDLLERDQQVSFSRDKWIALAKTGFFRLSLNDTQQSDSLCVKKEIDAFKELARGSLDLPFCLSGIAHSICIKLLSKYGSVSQKQKYLENMLDGTFVAAVANSEESGGTDIRSLTSSLSVIDDSEGKLKVEKRGASNISNANLVFASAWKVYPNTKPTLEVFLLEKHQVVQSAHNERLLGFATGQTGAIKTHEDLRVTISNVQLGHDRAGFSILKTCFNLERLYIPAIICGILEESIALAFEHLEGRVSLNRPMLDFQYVQEKICRIFYVKSIIWGLIQQICSTPTADFSHASKELAVLKTVAIEEGLAACLSFFEAIGYQAYTRTHIASKLLRDILAFKFLGGTKEQQKMVLFQELMQERAAESHA